MSVEELLKYANDEKPADFSKEFKSKLADKINNKLNPAEETIEDEGAGGEEDNEDN